MVVVVVDVVVVVVVVVLARAEPATNVLRFSEPCGLRGARSKLAADAASRDGAVLDTKVFVLCGRVDKCVDSNWCAAACVEDSMLDGVEVDVDVVLVLGVDTLTGFKLPIGAGSSI